MRKTSPLFMAVLYILLALGIAACARKAGEVPSIPAGMTAGDLEEAREARMRMEKLRRAEEARRLEREAEQRRLELEAQRKALLSQQARERLRREQEAQDRRLREAVARERERMEQKAEARRIAEEKRRLEMEAREMRRLEAEARERQRLEREARERKLREEERAREMAARREAELRNAMSRYAMLVRWRIQRNWRYLEVPGGAEHDMEARVAITLRRDGTIKEVDVVRSSKNGAFDAAALRTVENSAPVEPLPDEYAGDLYTIGVVFVSSDMAEGN
ncbi:MAG: cell envelope integrity protein TolA [Desulfatibacillaceae bacterium]